MNHRGLNSRSWWLLPSIGNTIFLSIFFILVFKTGNGLLGDGDTGYHIRAGEFILENRTIPQYDIFSFRTPPLRWTVHEWLSEVAMAAVHNLFGLTGIVIFFSLLIALIHLLLYHSLRGKSNDIVLATLVCLLAVASSTSHWLARPHIFSLALLLVWYFLLEAFQYRNKKTLYYLPPLTLLWVNMHGGFIMGLLLLGIYVGGNLINAWTAQPSTVQDFLTKAKLLAITGIVCLLTSALNPEGLRILLFPLELTSNRFIMDNVQEFLSPNFHDRLPFKYMLLILIGTLAASRLAVNMTELTLILLLTYMSLYSARYIPLFAVIVSHPLLRLLDGIVAELPLHYRTFLRTRSLNLAAIEARTKSYVWPIISIIVVVGLAALGSIKFEFDKERFPVAAVQFLLNEQVEGPMFNDDEFGDYIIYAAWPRYKVFMDGRSDMYGAQLGSEYIKVTRVLPGWEEILQKYQINWVIHNTDSPLTVALKSHKDWRLIYNDKIASIFVRNHVNNKELLQKYTELGLSPRLREGGPIRNPTAS